MNTQINKFHLSFIAALGLVFILAIFSYSKIRAIITSAALVNYTKQITLDLEKISGSLTDAETGQRGYLLTKDKIFLEPFNKGLREYPQHIKAVRQLILNDPEQERKLAAIETLAQRREDYMHKMLEIDKLRAATVKELLMGKSIMDSLQIEINTMIASEESRLEHTINQYHKQTIIAPLSLLILCLLALATIFTIYWKLNKSLAQARLLKVEAMQQAVYIEATKEIQESEKKYNMMLMKSPFCFGIMKGENMIITFANNAIKEVWGKGNDIEGKPFLEILPELIDTAFPNLLQNVMTTGVPYYGYDMLAQLNKNGKLEDGYFNFVYQPYHESDNIISGVTIIAIDVTKEVIAKKQVEEVEMRFRKMVEQAPVAICITRGENYVVELINEKNLEILGRTKEQVLNKPIFTAVPEGAKQGFEEILHGVFTTGKSYIANEQPLTLFRNGKEESMYLNITYEPLYDDDHKIDRIISVATDVTEQVTARKKIEESEQELRKLKEQLELSIQAGKIGVWFWDVKKDILTWSKEQREIYGVSDSEIITSATQFNELIFPEDLKRIKDDQSTGKKLEHEYDFRITRKNDDEIRWIKSRARNIVNEYGEIEFISGVNIDITEEVLSLNKIQESQDSFHQMIYSSPSMIAILSGEDLIIEVANDAIIEQLGKGKSIIGQPFSKAVPEMEEQGFGELLRQVYKTGIPYCAHEMPGTILHNGIEITNYYNFIYQAQRNTDNEITGIAIIATLVTPQAEFNLKLKESEHRFRTIADVSPVLIWTLDASGLSSYYNKTFLDFIGASKDEDISDWSKIVHPDDVQSTLKTINSAIAKRSSYSLECRLRRHDGQWRWVMAQCNSRLGTNNEFLGFVGSSVDITERKDAEAKITESEKQFSTLANNIQNLAWIADGEGWIYWYNQRWYDYTGTTLEKMKGWGWGKVHHPDHLESVVAFVKEAWHKPVPFELTFPLRGADGEYRWFLTFCVPILNAEGKIFRWIGTNTDIHQQILNDERKDEFISIASHELKTPLTTAKAYLQMLELSIDESNEDASLYVKKASESVNRLNELISELLDVSKIRLGKLNYNITTFNFNEMIESTVENIQLTTQTHAIIKTGKVSDEVTGDKDRLQQVVINLLNNAIKYSPNEEKVFIRIEQEINIIKVSVKDTGIGMNKQSINKIFEKYHRIEEHAVQFQGLGIGLFISYEIIQRHQGKLWAESELGKGSTFYFTIPLDINLPQ